MAQQKTVEQLTRQVVELQRQLQHKEGQLNRARYFLHFFKKQARRSYQNARRNFRPISPSSHAANMRALRDNLKTACAELGPRTDV